MKNLPHIKDIKSDEPVMTFPCDFPIKVMGATRADFATVIGNQVHELDVTFDPNTITQSLSKNGNYTSLTLTIRAQSREQLDSIYLMLTSHPFVKLVF